MRFRPLQDVRTQVTATVRDAVKLWQLAVTPGSVGEVDRLPEREIRNFHFSAVLRA